MNAALQRPTAGQEERSQFLAIVADEDSRRMVDQVVADLTIAHASVVLGNIADAIRRLGAQRSPRLLLVDISGIELPLSAVNELADVCEPGVTLIAIGDRNDVGLFRDLIAHGVADYLVKPVTPALLQRALLQAGDGAAEAQGSAKLGRLVAVLGTRGGVGVTMLTASVAWHIAERKRRRVALVDLDLQLGSLALALDLEPGHGLREALENPNRIDGLFVERAMTKHSDRLSVLSGEEPLDEAMFLDYAAVEILVNELRQKFHYVIVDLPRSFSPSTQHVLQAATNVIVVSDLSLAGMRDALRLVTLLPATNAGCQLTVVVNRVGAHGTGEIASAEFEKGIGRRIDVTLPFDGKTVAAALNVGRPVIATKTAVGRELEKLAESLSGGKAPRQPGLLRRLLGRPA